MKLNFNFNLVDLDGKEIENGNLGKILANNLINQTKGDAVKYWEWALALNKGDIIDLDTSDQDTLKTFIKDSEVLPVLTKAQSLAVFAKK
jgi:hypothetical protein